MAVLPGTSPQGVPRFRVLVLAAVDIPGAPFMYPSRTPHFNFSSKLGSFENRRSTKVITSDQSRSDENKAICHLKKYDGGQVNADLTLWGKEFESVILGSDTGTPPWPRCGSRRVDDFVLCPAVD